MGDEHPEIEIKKPSEQDETNCRVIYLHQKNDLKP